MAHRRSRDGAVAPVELRADTLARDLGGPGATCRPPGSVRVTARCRSSRAAAVSTGAAYLKVSSIRRASGIAPLSPKPPASSADVSPHGSSSNAVGSACVSAMICVPAWNPCRANTRHPGRLSPAGPRNSGPASRPGRPLPVLGYADQRTLLAASDSKPSTARPTRSRAGAQAQRGRRASRCGRGQRRIMTHALAYSADDPARAGSICDCLPTARHPALRGRPCQVVNRHGLACARLAGHHPGPGAGRAAHLGTRPGISRAPARNSTGATRPQ